MLFKCLLFNRPDVTKTEAITSFLMSNHKEHSDMLTSYLIYGTTEQMFPDSSVGIFPVQTTVRQRRDVYKCHQNGIIFALISEIYLHIH